MDFPGKKTRFLKLGVSIQTIKTRFRGPPASAWWPESWARRRPENLRDSETQKRTFHDTANRCHQNGIRFTPVVFDGHAGGRNPHATWSLESPNVSAQPLIAHRATINLEPAQRISLSLHDSARDIFRRVRLAASRDAPCPWDQTTGGQPGMTPTNGRPTLSLTQMHVTETSTRRTTTGLAL